MSEKMNPDIKAKWVSSLRSGEYKKIDGALAKNNAKVEMCFCALGVLCDLNAKITGRSWKKDESYDHYVYDGEGGALPDTILDWAGLNEVDPIIYRADGNGSSCGVSVVNDSGVNGKPFSFKQIADLIEKNL